MMYMNFAKSVSIIKEQVLLLNKIKSHKPIITVTIFDIWGIDFMGTFLSLFGNLYILLLVDYVPKWVETKATRTNDDIVMVDFVKTHIFDKFEIPKAIINDQRTNFVNRSMKVLLGKYYIMHKVSISYHAKKSGKNKIYNQEIKSILEKHCST
ncbi:hypothetical protein ACH5RR_039413 [Cinchona calisaya]|uniref:Integrase catalytic domain-containing protein n=1 Tax=Cinchona calisaya TaxID=153742 RepID=A0ABD2Y3D4_9GENT